MQSKRSTFNIDSRDAWGGMGSCSPRAYVPSNGACSLVPLESVPTIIDALPLPGKQHQSTMVGLALP
eukprot:12883196-Prorocentrum_lima.AAC.1